jgi:acetolactate synthase-1/2/3 large subunit
MTRDAAVQSTAEAYLELLHARGIEYLFGNGGTDFGPIIDAYAKRSSCGLGVPEPVTVPHEIVAVAMAHGYTMVSGRPQAVMVHTVAGTANAVGGLINARRSQVPMFFTAGRTPLTEGPLRGSRDTHIHWAQESFDQGSMVREWVKWDYELRFGADLEAVVDRALAVAASEPQGPVYLTLPREVLAEERPPVGLRDRPRMVAGELVAAPAAVAEAARLLRGAREPLVITRSVGRDPAAVAPLVRLADLLGAPVFDPFPTHANLPHDHERHLPVDPGPHLAAADVVVVVASDVPWTPKRHAPGPDATVIAVGSDPLHARYPVRGFPVDVNLGGRAALTLTALADALAASPPDDEVRAARRRRWCGERDRLAAAAGERAERGRRAGELDRAWMTACVEAMRPADAIVISELGFETDQLRVTAPGSFFGVSHAGVLGWGLGAALGAKLAVRDRTVIACIGDGSYLFGAPTAAHWVARSMDLPVLFLVWNNQQWAQVSLATRNVYPDGWAVRTGSFPFSDLGPSVDFEAVCRAAGGHGERVEAPADLPEALERALHAVQVEGRQALLNLVTAPT